MFSKSKLYQRNWVQKIIRKHNLTLGCAKNAFFKVIIFPYLKEFAVGLQEIQLYATKSPTTNNN